MPHIQFELDAMELVPSVANAAGVTEESIGWGLPKLWRHAWRSKSDVVSLVQIAGFFAGAVDRARLAEALVAYGFLGDLTGGTFRVLGSGRYLRIGKRQSAAGKARAENASRDQRGRLLAGQRLDDSAKELEDDPAAHQPETSSSSDQRSAISTTTASPVEQPDAPAPKKARKKSRSAEAFEWAQEERQKHTDTSDSKPPGQRLDASVAPILDELGLPGFKAAYRAYLADQGYPARQPTPWPFPLFVSQWRRYRANAAPAPLQAAPPAFTTVSGTDPYRREG